MIYKFLNIAFNGFGYAYDTDLTFRDSLISNHFRYGTIKLSYYDSAVSAALLADYLASLAHAMLTDDALARAACPVLDERPSLAAVQFASTLIFKPSDAAGCIKQRFWSLELCKVSSNLSLQHDKRYREFAEWMDGSPEAMLRILTPSYANPFLRYCYVEAVREWVLSQRKSVDMSIPGVHIGWFADHRSARKLHSAFEIARSASQAIYHRNSTITQLDCYRNNFNIPAAAAA